MDPGTQTYVIILQEKDGPRLLPIWIGEPEAQSIVAQMHNVKRARPLTHDLCKSIILGMGAALRRVQITRVENNTYYGELHLERDGAVARIDSRPSDAIAIALRLDAPIFAAESLLVVAEEEDDDESSDEAVGRPQAGIDPQELNAEELKRYLEHLRPEDFGKFNP